MAIVFGVAMHIAVFWSAILVDIDRETREYSVWELVYSLVRTQVHSPIRPFSLCPSILSFLYTQFARTQTHSFTYAVFHPLYLFISISRESAGEETIVKMATPVIRKPSFIRRRFFYSSEREFAANKTYAKMPRRARSVCEICPLFNHSTGTHGACLRSLPHRLFQSEQ